MRKPVKTLGLVLAVLPLLIASSIPLGPGISWASSLEASPPSFDDIPSLKYASSSIGVALKSAEREPMLLDPTTAASLTGSWLGTLQEPPGPGEPSPVSFTRNFRLSVDAGSPYEHEPSIAANPLNPLNLVVAAHHEDAIDLFVAVGAYYSLDGGDTWVGPIFMPPARPTDFFEADPAVAAGPSGSFYLAYLSIGSRQSEGIRFFFSSSVIVMKSVDGGATWEMILEVDPFYIDFEELFQEGIFVSNIILDKNYIAAGPGVEGDTIVVTFSEFMDGYDSRRGSYFTRIRIMAIVSTDGGLSWVGPNPIDETIIYYSPFGETTQVERVIQGSNPAVAPDGTIYVAYYDSGDDGWLEGSGFIKISKSLDGGQTWSEPVVAAIISSELPYYAPGRFRAWSSMFPSLDIAPDGTLYLVYAGSPDPPNTLVPSDIADVFLVYSLDGGDTWSEPLRVNDDEPGAFQFFPWLDVDENGVAHIIWGDTRFDAEDMFGFDVFYASFTVEEGITPNTRVTDYTGNSFLAFFLGDYFNVAAGGGQVYVVWTDVRESISERGGFTFIFTDTSIYFAKIGDRPEPTLTVTPSDIDAGRSQLVTIEAFNMPVNSVFRLAIGDYVLTELGFIFTDSNGTAEITVLLPPLAQGSYEVSLVDFTTATKYAVASIVVEDEVASGLDEVNSGLETLITSIDRASQSLASVEARIEAFEAMIADLQGGLQEVSSKIDAVDTRLSEEAASIRQAISASKDETVDQVTSYIDARASELEEDLVNAVEENSGEIISVVRSEGESQREALGQVDSKLDSISSAIESLSSDVEELVSIASSAASRSGISIGTSLLAFLAAAIAAMVILRKSLS